MESTAPTDQARPQILLVEDDDLVRRSLQLLLHGNGYHVRAFASVATAIADPAALRVAALITDFRLSDGDGIGMLRALISRGWRGRALMITGHSTPALVDKANASGFDAVLEKPLQPHRLMQALV